MRFADVPYPAEERSLDVDGARICWLSPPLPSDGPHDAHRSSALPFPILLVPPLGRGLLHHAQSFAPLAAAFGGGVIAYDPPGCGKSDKAGAALAQVDLAGQARVAAAVLGAARAAGLAPAGEPAVVLGTSFGAMVALALAEARPDLVRGLVLSDAGGAPLGAARRLVASLLASPAVLRRLGPGAWRRGLARLYSRPDHPALAANVDLAMKLIAGPDWPAYAEALGRTTRAALAAHGDVDRAIEAARRRDLPCLVIWGERDQVTRIEWGRTLAARLAAPLETIAGAGHFPNVEVPRAFEAAILRFAVQKLASPHAAIVGSREDHDRA